MTALLPPEVVRVAELMAEGLTDKVIAQRESVTKRTVRRRVARLLLEVQASTRFQAGYLIAKQGIQGGVKSGRKTELLGTRPKGDIQGV